MNCLYVYNHLSGGEKENKYHELIIEYLNKIYDNVDLFCVDKNSKIDDYLNTKHYDDVICSGGDGSISILINDLIRLGNKWNVGYIPLGTANDFAKNNEIPCNVIKSLDVIKNGQYEQVYLGKANDKCLLYALALGKVSGVSYKTSTTNKKRFSKFSYILEGIKELFSFKKHKLTLCFDSYRIDYNTPLILILDTHTLGGFKVNHGKRNTYDVVIIKPGLLNGVFAIIGIFLFGYSKTNTLFYDYFNLDNFSIETKENVSWCLDGEQLTTNKIDIQANQEFVRIYKK